MRAIQFTGDNLDAVWRFVQKPLFLHSNAIAVTISYDPFQDRLELGYVMTQPLVVKKDEFIVDTGKKGFVAMPAEVYHKVYP